MAASLLPRVLRRLEQWHICSCSFILTKTSLFQAKRYCVVVDASLKVNEFISMKIQKAHLMLSLNRRCFSYLDGLLFKELITTFVRLYLISWSLTNVVIGFLKSRPSRYNKRLLFKLMRCVSIYLKAYTTMLLNLSIDIKALTIQKQKQPQEMFYGKDVLQIFPKIHRKTPAPESLFLRKWQIDA